MTEQRKKPYVVEEQPGNKAICSCGRSENLPYCDGAHARENTGKSPAVVKVEDAKTVAWCGCGASDNFPYCDGSHSRL